MTWSLADDRKSKNRKKAQIENVASDASTLFFTGDLLGQNRHHRQGMKEAKVQLENFPEGIKPETQLRDRGGWEGRSCPKSTGKIFKPPGKDSLKKAGTLTSLKIFFADTQGATLNHLTGVLWLPK
jgi:hypothetical protein